MYHLGRKYAYRNSDFPDLSVQDWIDEGLGLALSSFEPVLARRGTDALIICRPCHRLDSARRHLRSPRREKGITQAPC